MSTLYYPWLIQGGITSTNITTVSLVKNYTNTNYIVFGNIITSNNEQAWTGQLHIKTKTLNNFTFSAETSSKRQWVAIGYAM